MLSPTRSILLAALALALAPATSHAAFGSPFDIGGNGGPSLPPPEIGIDGNGEWTVLYEGAQAGIGDGTAAVHLRNSDNLNEFDTQGSNATLAVAENGAGVFAYRFTPTSVAYGYRTPGGNWGTSGFEPAQAPLGQIAAGIDSSGDAVVAWKAGGEVRYMLSSGGTFSAPIAATPLGNPTFDGRAGDPGRDNGPRAFRDDAGNVALVYRDGNNVILARRSVAGSWSQSTVAPTGMYDVKADADPSSGRLVLGLSGGTAFHIYDGTVAGGVGATPVKTETTAANAAVDVAPGGDAVAAWDAPGQVRSASCVDGWMTENVADADSVSGVSAAMTTRLESLVAITGDVDDYFWTGATRLGSGDFTLSPLNNTDTGGVMAAAADHDGGGLVVAIKTGGGVVGYPYTSTATRPVENLCVPEGPTPPDDGGGPDTDPTRCPTPGGSAGVGPTRPRLGPEDCSDPSGPAGVCGPSGTIFPQCFHPTVLPTVCGPSGTVLVACRSDGPYVVACGGVGTILPPCKLPPPQIPQVCGGAGTLLPPCQGFNNPVVVCGPTAVLAQCNFPQGIKAAPIGLNDGKPDEITITTSCRKPLVTATALRGAVSAAKKPTCSVAAEVTKSRDRLLHQLDHSTRPAGQAWDQAAVFLGGLAGEFTGRSQELLDHADFNYPRYRNYAYNIAARYLGPSAPPLARGKGPNRGVGAELLGKPYFSPELVTKAPHVPSFTKTWAENLFYGYDDIARVAGPCACKASSASPRALGAARGKGLRVLKRAKLPVSGKRKRIRVKLSRKVVKSLVKEAKRQRRKVVPVRIALIFNSKPLPVARFADIRLKVRTGKKKKRRR